MAGGADRSQRTEAPTPRRKREAREKGQIARTPDLAVWGGLLAAALLLQVTVGLGARKGRALLDGMGGAIVSTDERRALGYLGDALVAGLSVAAPLLLGMLVVVVAANLLQVGIRPSVKRLKPELSRLNPAKGLRRMVSVSSAWELGKAVAKVAVLVLVARPAVRDALDALTSRAADSLDEIVTITASSALRITRDVALAGLLIAAADYGWQRRQLMGQLRMTKQEVREELKQQEGDPHVRAAIRSRQAALSRNRMIGMVASADVVVTNPTHYAVALRYEPERAAPEVVAKGAGAIALRIRAEAEAHGVPIVREPLLARTLHRLCDLGGYVPVELYEAVAQVLAFVFNLRQRGLAAGEHTLPRPVALP